jgi:hypothetical protein
MERADKLGERGVIWEEGEQRHLTLEEVKDHVGLWTNSDNWTDKKFQAVLQSHLDQAARYTRRSKRRQAELDRLRGVTD